MKEEEIINLLKKDIRNLLFDVSTNDVFQYYIPLWKIEEMIIECSDIDFNHNTFLKAIDRIVKEEDLKIEKCLFHYKD